MPEETSRLTSKIQALDDYDAGAKPAGATGWSLRLCFAPSRKQYRIAVLFTIKKRDFGANA